MPRGNQIALWMSSLGKTQTDKFTPLDLADLDLRLNLTSRNWVETAKTIEDIFDCIGEEVVSREVTRKIYRLPIEGEFVPKFCSPLAALSYGGAASPTGGTPANKVFTVVINADNTAGAFKLNLTYDGITTKTGSIPFDVTAAQFKTLYEELDNIGYGNTTVSRVGDTITVTYTGKRSYANIPLPTVSDSTLDGTDAVVAQTTAGAQKSHAITEMASYELPYTSMGIAFEDEPGSERLLVGVTVDNINFNLPEGNGIITFTAELIIRDVQTEALLVAPECITFRPYRTGDCLLTRNAVDLTEMLRSGTFAFSNNTLTGNSAYTGRGVKPTRLNRAIRRTRSLTYSLLSATEAVTAALYQEALANPEADVKRATSLRVGVEGDNITVNLPNALTELATGSGGFAFDNESEEAITRYVDTPTKVSGVAPTNLIVKLNETGTFLTPAS